MYQLTYSITTSRHQLFCHARVKMIKTSFTFQLFSLIHIKCTINKHLQKHLAQTTYKLKILFGMLISRIVSYVESHIKLTLDT